MLARLKVCYNYSVPFGMRSTSNEEGNEMKQASYYVQWQEGKFWLLCNDEKGEYQEEVTTFLILDNALNCSFHGVVLQHKAQKARRWLFTSAHCKSIYPLLDYVRMYLGENHKVRLVTPDGIIYFTKA